MGRSGVEIDQVNPCFTRKEELIQRSPMITTTIKELQDYRKKVADLESRVAIEMNSELASLPGRYGFSSLELFVEALKGAHGMAPKRRGRPPGKAKAAGAAAKPAAASAKVATGGKKARRKRATITPEMRDKVKALANAGKTGAQIAKEVGISLPSVQNVKKALGLVKARK